MTVSSVSSTPAVSSTPVLNAPTTGTTTASPGQSVLTALNGGSGVNVSALAQSLVDAERAPQKAIIDKAIKKDQSKISGYGAVLSSLTNFKNSLMALQDKSGFNSLSVQSNASGYFDVTTNSTAQPGNHKINVLSLASVQTNISGGFSSANAVLNNGAAITLNLTVGGQAVTPISVSATGANSPTANDIVGAINKAAAGVTAQIVDSGDTSGSGRYKIVLNSTRTGSASAFSMSTSATGENGSTALDFSTNVQAVSDAHITVDGVDMVRLSNNINDAIPGVTLNLLARTSTDGTVANSTPGSISLARDTSLVKSKVQALVDAFNNTKKILGTVSDSKSQDTYGATLVSDPLVRQIGHQLTRIVTGYSSTPGESTSSGNNVSALRDIGVTIQRDGTLALDATKLHGALDSNFQNVVKMLTGNQENASAILPGNRGLAGDAVSQLTYLMSSQGPILLASNNTNADISHQNQREADLESRMQNLLSRYMKQFSAMDSIVGQMNSLKVSLANQFAAWANQKN